MNCKVCSRQVAIIMDLPQSRQVTSLGRLIDGQASVYRCESCGHCQTETNIDLAEYYSKDYKTLMHSIDEDDVYEIINGRILWRAQHMAQTFISKLDLLKNPSSYDKLRFLDFGTGKGLFPKKIVNTRPSFDPFLYDISEDYISFWDQFCNTDHYSCFTLPPDWRHSFDVVSSMFSLEHVVDPIRELRMISTLLKPGGILYIVVPNMYSENVFDMIVIDHVQHYSSYSMNTALMEVGLTLIDADHASHDQASIYIACKGSSHCAEVSDSRELQNYLTKQDELSKLFSVMVDKILRFALSAERRSIVVVGAGVIGSFVKSVLDGVHGIDLFFDSNIHKQSKGWLSLPVISPERIFEYDNLNAPLYVIAHNPKMISLALEMIPQRVTPDRILTLF